MEKAVKLTTPTEYEECKTFWEYVSIKRLDDYIIKHANERQDKPWFIKALFAIRFKQGIPDYQFIKSNNK